MTTTLISAASIAGKAATVDRVLSRVLTAAPSLLDERVPVGSLTLTVWDTKWPDGCAAGGACHRRSSALRSSMAGLAIAEFIGMNEHRPIHGDLTADDARFIDAHELIHRGSLDSRAERIRLERPVGARPLTGILARDTVAGERIGLVVTATGPWVFDLARQYLALATTTAEWVIATLDTNAP